MKINVLIIYEEDVKPTHRWVKNELEDKLKQLSSTFRFDYSINTTKFREECVITK